MQNVVELCSGIPDFAAESIKAELAAHDIKAEVVFAKEGMHLVSTPTTVYVNEVDLDAAREIAREHLPTPARDSGDAPLISMEGYAAATVFFGIVTAIAIIGGASIFFSGAVVAIFTVSLLLLIRSFRASRPDPFADVGVGSRRAR